MKSKVKFTTRLSLLLSITPFGLFYCFYTQIPQTIPIHFNTLGEADRFVSKTSIEVFLLCGLGLLGLFFMKLLGIAVTGRSTKKRKEEEDEISGKLMDFAALFVTALFSGISIYYIIIVAHP
ncbi:DUF1648 domain-containing protein [Paenibacillus macerans]|uniref:DUF1648 domain-containing protein n=1 Tax=Paenibacillus macerans TaxID=44252 RepID=UPI00203D0DA4|nr:DUF1648 domain-containing protein [Paenibacillus macerans]MCM3702028.1 DUF1648 domain-containing protein [Paenibacillus macerans]